jgi:hypothetical protein
MEIRNGLLLNELKLEVFLKKNSIVRKSILYPVKDVSIVVVILCVNAEVLDRLRAFPREELEHDVAQRRVQDGRLVVARSGLVLLGDGESVFVRRLLVEHVAVAGNISSASSEKIKPFFFLANPRLLGFV